MKEHYDFSKGIRGKFYRPDAEFRLPVYLEAEVESYLEKSARSHGLELDELVNRLLKRDIDIIESGK